MEFDGAGIDQILFSWSPRSLVGTRGVGPVASSLPPEELQSWTERLRQHIWAAEEEPGGQAGLVYLCFGPHAAIVHKLPVTDENGRPGSTFTHVLIGPLHLLTARGAVALTGWTGWLRDEEAVPSDGVLPRLSVGSLRGEGGPDVPEAAFTHAVPLIGQILADPAASFSMVTPDVPAERIVQVVLDVLGDIGGPWTFSTRESADAASRDPRLVFLIHDPGFSSHGSGRIRVAPKPTEDAELAAALVDAYRRDGAEAMSALRPARAPVDGADVEAWAKSVQIVPGVLADPVRLLFRAGRGILSRRERDFVESARGRAYLVEVLEDVGDKDLATLLDSQPGHAQTWIGEAVLHKALNRCLSGFWPATGLLTAVRNAQPSSRAIETVLQERLKSDPRNIDRYDRPRRRAIAVAVARVLDPDLPLTRGPVSSAVTDVHASELLASFGDFPPARSVLIRMVIDGARDRQRPDDDERAEIRRRLESAAYHVGDVLAAYGSERAAPIDAFVILLELAYGPGIAHTAAQVHHIVDRLGARYHNSVLVAIGVRTPAPEAAAYVEHVLAKEAFRHYEKRLDWRVPETSRAAERQRPGTLDRALSLVLGVIGVKRGNR